MTPSLDHFSRGVGLFEYDNYLVFQCHNQLEAVNFHQCCQGILECVDPSSKIAILIVDQVSPNKSDQVVRLETKPGSVAGIPDEMVSVSGLGACLSALVQLLYCLSNLLVVSNEGNPFCLL